MYSSLSLSLFRSYVSASPPLPPPRRGSESVPGSPQHFRTRIHYTPEPQRRIYRTIDQWVALQIMVMWCWYGFDDVARDGEEEQQQQEPIVVRETATTPTIPRSIPATPAIGTPTPTPTTPAPIDTRWTATHREHTHRYTHTHIETELTTNGNESVQKS